MTRRINKKEYLVQAPHLKHKCTVRDQDLKPEHIIIKERVIPECPECGDTETYRETWDDEPKPIKCRVCGYPNYKNIQKNKYIN